VYELIAGERRLRASKMAGIAQVPVLIRESFDDDKTKLEIAIIENLQREDLNAIDRAKAFDRLVKEFGFKHTDIAEKVGKSREYVSNTIRLLMLPPEMQQGLAEGKISEGHTRPLLMLIDRPQEQNTLFREIMLKRLTVRDTESIARRIATDRVRKKEYLFSPEVLEMERELTAALGTRVAIEPKENGGKVSIDYMNEEDLRAIFATLHARMQGNITASPVAEKNGLAREGVEPIRETRGPFSSERETETSPSAPGELPMERSSGSLADSARPFPQEVAPGATVISEDNVNPLDDRSKEEKELDENSFNPNSFSI